MIGRSLVIGAFSVIAAACTWEIYANFDQDFDFLLGRPSKIGINFIQLFKEGALTDFLISFLAISLALLVGVAFGILFGVLAYISTTFRDALYPFIWVFTAVPVLALAPLFILWFGVGLTMKIAVGALGVFLSSFLQTAQAIEGIGSSLLQFMKTAGANNTQMAKMVVIPAILSSSISGLKYNSSIAILGVFIGEFITSNQGIGYIIVRSSSLYNAPRALAASLMFLLMVSIFILLSFLLSKFGLYFAQRLSVDRSVFFFSRI